MLSEMGKYHVDWVSYNYQLSHSFTALVYSHVAYSILCRWLPIPTRRSPFWLLKLKQLGRALSVMTRTRWFDSSHIRIDPSRLHDANNLILVQLATLVMSSVWSLLLLWSKRSAETKVNGYQGTARKVKLVYFTSVAITIIGSQRCAFCRLYFLSPSVQRFRGVFRPKTQQRPFKFKPVWSCSRI